MISLRIPLVLALLANASAACVPKRMEVVMPSWRGHHFSEVFAAWGAPQAAFHDGRGGRYIIWTDSVRTLMPSKSTAAAGRAARDVADQMWRGFQDDPHSAAGVERSFASYQMFHFDRNGIVRSWDWLEKPSASASGRKPYCPPGFPVCPVK